MNAANVVTSSNRYVSVTDAQGVVFEDEVEFEFRIEHCRGDRDTPPYTAVEVTDVHLPRRYQHLSPLVAAKIESELEQMSALELLDL